MKFAKTTKGYFLYACNGCYEHIGGEDKRLFCFSKYHRRTCNVCLFKPDNFFTLYDNLKGDIKSFSILKGGTFMLLGQEVQDDI